MRGDEQRVWSVHAENRLEFVWLKKQGPRNRVPSFRSDEDRDKRPRREQPVNTARGFISPPPSHPSLPSFPPPPVPLVLRHPVLSIFCRASSFRSSLLSFAPSSLLPFFCSSVCGQPQIIRINIITSLGAASLFLSPRSTHHDATHDRFRAPVKPFFSSFAPYLPARTR